MDISKKTKSQESAIFSSPTVSNLKVTAKVTLLKEEESSKLSMALMLKAFGKTTSLYKFRLTLRFNFSINELLKKYTFLKRFS